MQQSQFGCGQINPQLLTSNAPEAWAAGKPVSPLTSTTKANISHKTFLRIVASWNLGYSFSAA
jgi:hypothetical protein